MAFREQSRFNRLPWAMALGVLSIALLAAPAAPVFAQQGDAADVRTDAMFGMHGFTPVPQDNVFATTPGLEQQARRSTFTFNALAPLAFTSNALAGPSGVPTDQNSAKFNPSAGLSWATPVFDLPFRFTANARAELDRFTAVPSAGFDKIFVSGRLQYVDANNDQAFSPYISYGPRLSYAPFYQSWLQTRQDLTFGINKTFNYDANFQRVAFSGNSFAEAIWSFGVTTGFQRRFANPAPSSWAVFLVPSASYVISPQWNVSAGIFMQRRGFDSFQGVSDEEWFIEPVATLEFVLPSSWFGSERNAALIGRPALDFQVAYEKNWSPLATFNYDQWTAGGALKFGWRF